MKSYKVGTHINLKKKDHTKLYIFLAGVLVALLAPFLIDWVLFGTPTPCHTIKVYEDGSSLQACEVRN